jgi:hypothetical protein
VTPALANRSLRFRASAGAYLNRTPASAGNRKTWTWSAWIKRGFTGDSQIVFSSWTANTDAGAFEVYIDPSDRLVIQQWTGAFRLTTQVFRDPSAWYHIVIAMDTTQATASNRLKLYVNGSEVTSFSTNTNPTLNQELAINQAGVHYISSYKASLYYVDGYLTEVNFIDGQALTPNYFGATNPSTGAWQPATYRGTYGTNGFYLPFTNIASTSTLGNDFSGNGNNWTTNNISLTAGSTYDSMTDVPTLTSATASNFCVMNAASIGADATLSAGNLQIAYGSGGTIRSTMGTFGMSSGKWYWEITTTASSLTATSAMYGITNGASSSDFPEYPGFNANGWAYHGNNGSKYNNATATSYGATYGVNDVIGVAFDADAGSLTFYKNNVSQGVAFSGLPANTYFPAVGDGSAGNTFTAAFNFGQRPFAYTPPTGFVALNTFNLPTPTIGATASTQAINYTGATTYSGDSTSNRVITTGGGSQFVWIKRRNSTTNHILFDVLRGAGDTLYSNLTSAAVANGGFYVQQFGTTGFTLGTGGDAADNITGGTYVAWNWNAGGTTVTNTAGSISAQVRANPTAGFSIVTYTGTGTNATVGHGLGVAPSWVIVKVRNASGESWGMYHVGLTSAANAVYLNLTQGQESAATQWNSTAPTSSVFSIGTNARVNGNTNTFVAYCFATVAGYSSFGRYTGTGSSDGAFVYTGFRPRYVMFMRTDTTGGAAMVDSSRDPFNVAGQMLYAYGSDAEGTNPYCDLVSNGFKVRGTSLFMNASGGTYIYMAFAETPFKFANAR